jgi:hypothetical protein
MQASAVVAGVPATAAKAGPRTHIAATQARPAAAASGSVTA